MLSGYHHLSLAAGWVPAVLLVLGGLQSAQEKLMQLGKGKAPSRQQCKFWAWSPWAALGARWVRLCRDAAGRGASWYLSCAACGLEASAVLCQDSWAEGEGLGEFNLAPFPCCPLGFLPLFFFFSGLMLTTRVKDTALKQFTIHNYMILKNAGLTYHTVLSCIAYFSYHRLILLFNLCLCLKL